MAASPRLGIIDYGAGNVCSVVNSFRALGHEGVMLRTPQELEGITHLVLPGVGAFGDCAEALRAQGLAEPVRDWVREGRKPFLGICVGYQVLFESGEESPGVPGLGVFAGHVRRFTPEPGLKIPHMGWNSVTPSDTDDLLWAKADPPCYYFVHSYYPEPADGSLVAARCRYGSTEFAAAIRHGNALATQFHPEKSQLLGLRLLDHFMNLSPL